MNAIAIVLGALGVVLQGAPGEKTSEPPVLEGVEREVRRAVARVRGGVASIEVDRGVAMPRLSLSALAFDDSGGFVTTGGALSGVERVTLRLLGGRAFLASVVGLGPGERVGMLRIEGRVDAPPFALDPEALGPGSLVLAIGNPYGLEGSVSVGWVGGVGRQVGRFGGLIQTSAPVNRGDAGGALANLRGEVVGMLVTPLDAGLGASPGAPGRLRIATREDLTLQDSLALWARGRLASAASPFDDPAVALRAEGIHFALPIHRVLEEARSILERPGSAEERGAGRRWLGLYLDEALDPALRAQISLPERTGLLVREIYAGSPAARAGFEPHDVLVAFGGESVGSAEILRRCLDKKGAGETVDCLVLRRGARRTIAVTVE